ncbi:MAG: type II toxin-antitoxin system VapB family antitoxin [Acidobacteria bacterium]|nr:type II toxin-antitoxin system VapB family antitoxin [Acidobacteriota bacterium]
MALNIKNPETETLTRRLAALTGESITEAVTASVRERYDRKILNGHRDDQDDFLERIRAISESYRARPEGDVRSEDEILGYNEYGGFD